MAVRFEATSAGLLGTTYTLQIHDSEYAGSAVDVILGGEGFTLSYEPEDERPDVAVIPSTLSFSIIRNADSASAFDSFLSDFIGADEGRFTMRVLNSSDELYWCGYILADQVKYIDTRWADTNSTFAFKAKDGLNRLKAIDYNDDGEPYAGRATFAGHLFNCLDKAGLKDFWGGGDDYLHAVVKWYTTLDTSATLSDNSLFRTYVDHAIAYTRADNGEYTYKSAYDILQAICASWGARIFLANGVWHFEQFNEYRETGDIYLHRYDKVFNKISTDSSTDYEVDEVAGDFITAASGVVGYLAPIRRVEINYNLEDDANYLQGLSFVESVVQFPVRSPPGQNVKYRISGLLTSDVQFTSTHFPVFCVVGLFVELQIGASTYKLERAAEIFGTNIVYDDPQWVEDGAATYEIVMPLQISGLPVTQVFDFVTPESPGGEDTASISFGYFDVRQTVVGGNPFESVVDTVSIDLANAGFQAMNLDGTFPEIARLNTISNPDSPNASEVISKDILFGDAFTFTRESSITILDSGEHVATTEWRKGLSGTARPIRRLLAQELLYQRRKAIKLFDATFIEKNPFFYYNVLKLNTGEQFIPLQVKYDSRQEIWTGRYTSIGYSDTLTGVSVVIDVPIGPDPSTGGTPPGEGPQTIPGVSADNPITGSFDDGGHIISTTGESSIGGVGDIVDEIPIVSVGVDGLITSGDEVALVDPVTGATQIFTVASNVGATDTVISIVSATLTETFREESYVTTGTQTFVTNIQSGASAINRYVQRFTSPTATLTITENSGILPANSNLIDVFYNGVLLTETIDYNVSGSDINLTFTPKSSASILVKFFV